MKDTSKPSDIHIPEIELFEPWLEGSDGLTGQDDDPSLVYIALVQNTYVHWGAPMARYNFLENPRAFIENSTVSDMLLEDGDDAFPVLVVDGVVKFRSRYPTPEEFNEAVGIENLGDLLIPFSEEQVAAIKERAERAQSCSGSCFGCTGCG